MQPRVLLIVLIAGGAGSVVRYVGATLLNRAGAGLVPWGTFAVNVVGSLCIGAVAHLATHTHLLSREAAVGLTAGFLGGLTTFSSFALEGERLLAGRQWWLAGAYTLGSVAVGIGAAWAGARLCTRLLGT